MPFASNHSNNALATAPLNTPGMFWTWQGGYKFTEQDLLELSWVAVPANPSATLGTATETTEHQTLHALQASALRLKASALL